ncbi:MAG TPA: bifunctional 5,10-methylenetetrahydrofolate dehydrogenase/5,10-methenyltetrahydrofolate cyclohydrolase, partial [Thermoanaerobaculia bacterium]|nr:bifunctional 5,10-methylenetetrahydrofolate dehydrogenase/5,10-methenyltetrahydrofolate cyclohydrolase [Thermoanaerobaculia bacterium]
MSAVPLDGKKTAALIRAEVAEGVRALAARGVVPGLAAVLVGDNPASAVYVRNKGKAAGEAGIASRTLRFPADLAEEELLRTIEELNRDETVDAILVQLPLPAPIRASRILEAVDPAKDVDGFHPVSVGRLVQNRPGPRPCTPAGVMELLRREGIALRGTRAVVVGRSEIVGRPMALLLTHADATVTVAHSKTRDLPAVCREADLLVAAMGKPGFVTGDFVKEGAVVVDVGINRITDAADLRRFDEIGDTTLAALQSASAGNPSRLPVALTAAVWSLGLLLERTSRQVRWAAVAGLLLLAGIVAQYELAT